ncbi:MAG: hypothetical protein K2Y27_09485, partial [Xanthobacteraceae bacterium]|nr:hypothetical protein [Xanthobacteraceae bacterium]
SFLIFWQQFAAMGGYYNRTGVVSGSALWIVIPTIEGITYASLIALYDGASVRLPSWLDRSLAKIGEWSYSIYLLHFFPVVLLSRVFAERIGSAENFFPVLLIATMAFLLFAPVAGLSYIYFETFFLKLRRPYLRKAQQESAALAKSTAI